MKMCTYFFLSFSLFKWFIVGMKIIQNVWAKNLFTGPKKLFQSVKRHGNKISLKRVKDFLASTLTYQLHKPSKRRFKRRKIIVSGPNVMYDIDLLDLTNLRGQNHNKRYLLTIIDVFSKKAYAYPLRTKTAKEVAEAFVVVLKQNKEFLPQSVRSDHGMTTFYL